MQSITPLRATLLGLASLALLGAGPMAPSANAKSSAWLGVYTQELSDDLRDGLDVDSDGILVNRVIEGSPADRAGLRKGDILVTFNTRTVTSPEQLAELVSSADVGQEVTLSILRGGDRQRLTARLGERPAGRGDTSGDFEMFETPEAPEPPEAPKAPRASRAPRVYSWNSDDWNSDDDRDSGKLRDHVREMVGDLKFDSNEMPGLMGLAGGRGRLGVRIESMSPDLASALGSSETRGVFVLEVLKDTPAERAGLKAGDVITAVNGKSVYDTDDLVRTVRDESGKVSLSVTRKGARRTVEAELEDSPNAFYWNRAGGPMGFGRIKENPKQSTRLRIAPDAKDFKDDAALRDELKELREQLRELRRQLEDMKR